MDKQKRNGQFSPSVIGVIFQLNYCLDFSDSEFIELLADYYLSMKQELVLLGNALPANKDSKMDIHKDLLLRELDCAVIKYIHQSIDKQIQSDMIRLGYTNKRSFDTVRGIFTEGGPAFEGAGIQAKSHIQVCIRNLNCIKGFFIPRKEVISI